MSAHFQIDKLLEFHAEGEIVLPSETQQYLHRLQPKANATPPTLSLAEATIVDVLFRTYIKGVPK